MLFLLEIEERNLKQPIKNFYVPVAISSTQNNAKLLQQLKSCFKRTIKWNKYQPKYQNMRQINI